MKNLIKPILFIVLLLTMNLCYLFGGYFRGQKDKQTEIENRAKELNKECYTNQDIEYIIFSQSQL